MNFFCECENHKALQNFLGVVVFHCFISTLDRSVFLNICCTPYLLSTVWYSKLSVGLRRWLQSILKTKKWSMKGSSLKFFGKLGATFCWISLYHYQNFERKFNDEVSIYFLPIEFSQKGKNFSIMRCSSDLTILSQLLLKKNQKEHAFLPFPNHKFLRKV